MTDFRILSLDGGGIKGTFTASFLATLEEMTQKKVVDHFDLITGTSAGGIIALGLGLGMSAREIQKFFQLEASNLFPPSGNTGRILSWFQGWFHTKYDGRPLEKTFQKAFDNKTLGDSRIRLVIPSYDAVGGDIHLYKTYHQERFKEDYKVCAWEVAMATSAAPTYFPAFRTSSGLNLIDGGVFANNPVMVAIIEALANLGKDLRDLSVLSIGTTGYPFSLTNQQRFKSGYLIWKKDIIELFIQSQGKVSLAQAELLLKDRLLRVDPIVEKNKSQFDDLSLIEDLIALGHSEARHWEKKISHLFLQEPVEKFEPSNSI